MVRLYPVSFIIPRPRMGTKFHFRACNTIYLYVLSTILVIGVYQACQLQTSFILGVYRYISCRSLSGVRLRRVKGISVIGLYQVYRLGAYQVYQLQACFRCIILGVYQVYQLQGFIRCTVQACNTLDEYHVYHSQTFTKYILRTVHHLKVCITGT